MPAVDATTARTASLTATTERGVLRSGPVVIAASGAADASVLRAAALVTARLRRSGVVVAAVDPLDRLAWYPLFGAYSRESSDTMLANNRARIGREIAAAGATPAWPLAVEDGSPATVLARETRERKSAMLIMGLGRRRPIERLLGAETVIRVVRQADCPVLAVPATFERLPATVVVGVDFSDACQQALECMIPLLDDNATVHLVHVWEPSGVVDDAHVDVEDRYRASLSSRFQRLIAAVEMPSSVTVRTEEREGKPAQRLIDFADAHHADLLVVGRHGQGMIERLLVGSVASRVLRGANCAVLVVPEYALHNRDRALALHGLTRSPLERERWAAEMDAFTRRNVGRLTILENSDNEGVPFSREQGYPLFGVTFREPEGELEIILGEEHGRRRHMTRVIANLHSMALHRAEDGSDRALAVRHDNGETLLRIVPGVISTGAPMNGVRPARKTD